MSKIGLNIGRILTYFNYMLNELITSIQKQSLQDITYFGYDRCVLKKMAQNAVLTKSPHDYQDVIVAILRWGGLHLGIQSSLYKKALKSIPQKINNIITALALPNVKDRFDAFNLKGSAKIDGVGPSFFTKIIFFFDSTNAIILDKWISYSLFSIFDSMQNNPVSSEIYGYKPTYSPTRKELKFSRTTKSSDYVNAINDIALLRTQLSTTFPQISIEDVEMALFSQGRGKGIWRIKVAEYMENFLRNSSVAKGKTISKFIL